MQEPKEPKQAAPINKEQAEHLYNHIRAIEALEADKKDIQEDITERKKLVTELLPINKDVLDLVIKRRKKTDSDNQNFDTMLEIVEEAVQEVEKRHAKETRERIETARKNHAERATEGPDDEIDDEAEEPSEGVDDTGEEEEGEAEHSLEY